MDKTFVFLIFFISKVCASGELTHNDTTASCSPHDNSIHLASFRWNELGVYFTISSFIVVAGLAKLGFHKLHWLSSKVPESCLLVILGLMVGLIMYFAIDPSKDADPCLKVEFPKFTSETFFFVLLPPIILDSAYSLHDRMFLDNLGTILLFAVIGTLFNVFAIGGTLFGAKALNMIPNMQFTLVEAFLFSSFISAVDPVAVLAIFQELGVNQNLYFLIFGESLLNDGVTVALYNTMKVFARMDTIEVGQIFLAILGLFIVSLGGIFFGVLYGLVTALITKFTYSVRVVEPLAVLGLAYLSYLTAELFHFSGIISLIVCGIIQAHYSFFNISLKSYTCVKYFTKMASATSDTVVFMFLGMVLVNEDHDFKFKPAFVLWTIFLCLIYRFISTFALSALVNMRRTRSIDLEEQFITAYGGLRGAVAFSLANTLDENTPNRKIFIFTTLMVILFTVFVQGITIKPLVHLLNIRRRNNDKKKLSEEIAETSMNHVMAGVDEILGHHGDFYIKEMITYYNEKYLKKIFLYDCGDSKLTRLFEKICLAEHYAHLYGPVAMVSENIKPKIDYASEPRVRNEPISPMVQDEVELRRNATTRRRSVRDFFNRRETIGTPGSAEPSHDRDLLRRALRDNRYNKLHYTYNPNLMNEEDQEIATHLNRRSINARRMSLAASARPRHDGNLPGQVRSPGGLSFGAVAKSVVVMQRTNPRLLLDERLSGLASLLQETIPEEIKEEVDETNSGNLNAFSPNEDIPLITIESNKQNPENGTT